MRADRESLLDMPNGVLGRARRISSAGSERMSLETSAEVRRSVLSSEGSAHGPLGSHDLHSGPAVMLQATPSNAYGTRVVEHA
jgi:hypothetical protein